MPGSDWQGGQSHRRHYREPKRQKRGKRGASIDPPGYDAGKKIKGKKRHILVDTQGLLIHAIVHAADIQDRDGGALVMATMFGMYPFLLKLYADGGYQGPLFRAALKKIMAQVNVEIVKRSDQSEGLRCPAEAMGGRANFRLARTMPKARQGLGKSQPQGARFPAPRLHQAYVEKAMQSRINSSDRLLDRRCRSSASRAAVTRPIM